MEGNPPPVDRTAPACPLTVRYLSHSAWLIQTPFRTVLLDYGELPQRPADHTARLSEGCLDLSQVSPDWLHSENQADEKPLIVFASHQHRDHAHPGLFSWLQRRATVAGASTNLIVFGLDVAADGPAGLVESSQVAFVRPGQNRMIGDGLYQSFASTDQGVALLVQFPELTLYHGGDLALWADEPGYRKQHAASMQALRQAVHSPVDLAFIPVCTSDGYQESMLVAGAVETVDILRPRHLFPMHGYSFESLYQRFADLVPDALPDYSGSVHVSKQAGDVFCINDSLEGSHGQ